MGKRAEVWTGLALIAFLAVAVLLFPGAGRDDAYISYWPAHTLADAGSITNYNGESLEQSSSLATVLVLAAAHWLSGAPLAWLGWLFGLLAGCLSVLFCAQFARHARGDRALLAPLCLALAHPFTYWAASGMETAFETMLIFGWVLAAIRANEQTSRDKALTHLLPWTVALCAVRPEAPFVLLCVIAAATALPGVVALRLRAPLWLALTLSFGVITAARVVLFDSWLPQPALAKSGRPLAESLELGFQYLSGHPLASLITCAAAAVGLAHMFRARRPESPALSLAALFVTAQLGFVLFSGGDWMEGARFLAPTLGLSLVLLLGLLPARAAAWALASLLSVFTALFAQDESRSLFAWQDAEVSSAEAQARLLWREGKSLVHLRDAPTLLALEELLRAQPSEEPRVVLTGQGGMLLYRLLDAQPEALFVVDRYGLIDRALSSSPAALMLGSGRLGLNLGYADLLERWDEILSEAGVPEPDLIFDVGIGGREDAALVAKGYVQVYRQEGEVRCGKKRQPAKQVIYVKQAWADALPGGRIEPFEFSPLENR